MKDSKNKTLVLNGVHSYGNLIGDALNNSVNSRQDTELLHNNKEYLKYDVIKAEHPIDIPWTEQKTKAIITYRVEEHVVAKLVKVSVEVLGERIEVGGEQISGEETP